MHAPDPFRWVKGLEDQLAGSAMPHDRQEIDWLIQQGIRAIVSLSSLRPDILRYLKEHCMDHLDFQVSDFEAPEMGDFPTFLGFVQSHLSQGQPTLIHCGAGIGRTSTLIAGYLISQGDHMPEAVSKAGREPESADQMAFLRELAASTPFKEG